MKAPRKKKKQIPEGIYCYGSKPCPYLNKIDVCRITKTFIIDQVKDCGIKRKI